jgi:CO/xanthine dehydrogenase Mo-binding subunit
VVSGDTLLVPNEGVTAGSFSMPNCATAVRQASAEVRAILLDLGATRLGQGMAGLKVVDGVIQGSGNAQVSYWDLVLGQALEREANGQAKPKPASEHRYIGRSVPRLDLPAKVLGQSIFVQELRPAGMVYGAVVRPPTYGASLTAVDLTVAERMPGVVKVIRNGSFLGVVARREAQAQAAARALGDSCQWNVPKRLPGTQAMPAWLEATKPDRVIETLKKPRTNGTATTRTLEAAYYRPYQMHASIGTSAALGTMGADGVLIVQTHSQSVFETRAAISRMLDMPLDKVRLQHVQGAGCYGHNMADDAAADLDHDDHVTRRLDRRAQAQPVGQVDDGQDRAAKIDHAAYEARRMRHRRRRGPAADLAYGHDVHAELLLADAEGDQFAAVAAVQGKLGHGHHPVMARVSARGGALRWAVTSPSISRIRATRPSPRMVAAATPSVGL